MTNASPEPRIFEDVSQGRAPVSLCPCGSGDIGHRVWTMWAENQDRIRAEAECASCGSKVRACFAKRLSPEPDATGNREAWGPVGKWTIREVP